MPNQQSFKCNSIELITQFTINKFKDEHYITTSRSSYRCSKIKSEEIGTKMDICVVDAGANLVAFARMDGAWMGSIDISFKSKTSAWFTMDCTL
jgi:hypothetical protein